ncbi:hypothetical protein QAD02_006359 [Eretmocerus hayati]|uniref:Uncharacterized protein n=1 Tax=Eretmocerus hayati TaxID=131215 RepID=A0ACC2N0R3_9HYME|nr:hypothetical protein QAD02_006359 [Eretmocerus hayati]
MSYLKAVGDIIEDNGLTNILIETDLIAPGSVRGFLTAKNFNRAKKLHVEVSLALKLEHISVFLSEKSIAVSNDALLYLKYLLAHGIVHDDVDNPEVLQLFEIYQLYKKETLAGEHGKTAQHFLMYTQLIDYFLILDRSVRTSDLELFIYILPKITNIMFTMNHYNYARWLVVYHNNLLNVEKTHPGLGKILKDGGFGVKRTDKNFSRQETDLVMEQTANCDAGRSQTGISHFTNSEGAIMRWSICFGAIRELVSSLLDEAGMNPKQAITNDLRECNIRRSQSHVKKFREALNVRINPFSPNLPKDKLFNLVTGESAPSDVTEFLLSVETVGDKQRKQVMLHCEGDLERFGSMPIHKNQIRTFKSLVKKTSVRVGEKTREMQIQKNLFGRLLGISIEKKIDLHKVLGYPLTQVPSSMCHLDGNIHKTDKAALTKGIEKLAQDPSDSCHNAPPYTDIVVVDGFLILHTMLSVPPTFGLLALKYLKIVCSMATSEVHVIFDKYQKPSIKDTEHMIRECYSSDFTIIGPEQARHGHFDSELRNDKFKEALVKFFINHWLTNDAANIIRHKILYVNFDKCYKYIVAHGRVAMSIDDEFTCERYEEADTKIMYHLRQLQTPGKNVSVRASDTDVLVIILSNFSNLRSTMNIWMDYGTANHRRFLNINVIYGRLGEKLCKSFAFFHALTGCDYNPSMLRRGKVKPLQILVREEKYQDAFIHISDAFDDSCKVVEEFVCRMYARKDMNLVNDVRHDIFLKSFSGSNFRQAFMKKARYCDASSYPPCQVELHQQILRSRYISEVWCNAYEKIPTDLRPENSGWKISDGKYTFHWFDGQMMPAQVGEIIVNEKEPEEMEDSDEDSDDSAIEDDSETSTTLANEVNKTCDLQHELEESQMIEVDRICCICESKEPVIVLFEQHTLIRCTELLAIRKFFNFKFKDIHLPENVSATVGYHVNCYRQFQSVQRKYKEKYEEAKAAPRAIKESTSSDDVQGQRGNEGAAGHNKEEVPVTDGHSPITGPRKMEVDNSQHKSTGGKGSVEMGNANIMLASQDELESSNCGNVTNVWTNEEVVVEFEVQVVKFFYGSLNVQPCLFCKRFIKRHKGRNIVCSVTTNYNTMEQCEEYATQLGDLGLCQRLYAKKESGDSIYYHRICKIKFRDRSRIRVRKNGSEWYKSREIYNRALKQVTNFVRENVLRKKKCLTYKFVEDMLVDNLIHMYKNSAMKKRMFNPSYLRKKLDSIFRNEIDFFHCQGESYLIPKNGGIIPNVETVKAECEVLKSAYNLRSLMLESKNDNVRDATDVLSQFCLIALGGYNAGSNEVLVGKALQYTKNLLSDILQTDVETENSFIIDEEPSDVLNKFQEESVTQASAENSSASEKHDEGSDEESNGALDEIESASEEDEDNESLQLRKIHVSEQNDSVAQDDEDERNLHRKIPEASEQDDSDSELTRNISQYSANSSHEEEFHLFLQEDEDMSVLQEDFVPRNLLRDEDENPSLVKSDDTLTRKEVTDLPNDASSPETRSPLKDKTNIILV